MARKDPPRTARARYQARASGILPGASRGARAERRLDLIRAEARADSEGHHYFAGTRRFSSSVKFCTTTRFRATSALPASALITKKRCPSLETSKPVLKSVR